jgi:hypothetical protein
VSKASVLRIVRSAELKRLSGSRPQIGWGAGAGDFNGRPPQAPYPHLLVQPAERGKPVVFSARVLLTESPKRKCGGGHSG